MIMIYLTSLSRNVVAQIIRTRGSCKVHDCMPYMHESMEDMYVMQFNKDKTSAEAFTPPADEK